MSPHKRQILPYATQSQSVYCTCSTLSLCISLSRCKGPLRHWYLHNRTVIIDPHYRSCSPAFIICTSLGHYRSSSPAHPPREVCQHLKLHFYRHADVLRYSMMLSVTWKCAALSKQMQSPIRHPPTLQQNRPGRSSERP